MKVIILSILFFLPLFLSGMEIKEPPTNVIKEGKFIGKWWNPLPGAVVKKIYGKSWKEDCPVPLKDLAYVQVSHYNFDGEIKTGELVFHKKLADEIIDIMMELFISKFPIEKMHLIDDYDADDEKSMEDNNSCAFCSRAITGKPGVYSKHSYGGTIDLNPIQNPYVRGVILPKSGVNYLDRSKKIKGKIDVKSSCFKAFSKRGYMWGGDWISLKDFQHFEKESEEFLQ